MDFMRLRVISMFASLLASAVLWGQTDDPVFRAAASEVRVDIRVLSGDKPVTGLQASDFLLFDGDEAREIRYFGADNEALTVLFLLDVSGSMRTYLDQVSARAQKLASLLKEGDRLGVMAFSKETDFIYPFTSRLERAASGIQAAARPGILPAGTAINASLLDAARAMKEKAPGGLQQGRRAIIILTDNNGLNYKVPDDMALRALLDADTVLNAVLTNDAERPRLPRSGYANADFSPADVFRLVEQSGGDLLKMKRADDAFERMMNGLRSRYSLLFSPAAANGPAFRRIRVEPSPALKKRYGNLKILARAGYYPSAQETNSPE
jgi:VWFA-related protein